MTPEERTDADIPVIMIDIIAEHVMTGDCDLCGHRADLHMIVLDYCTQNRGLCSECSLSSYGKDCRNQPLTDRGARRLVCIHCVDRLREAV
jgi:hypothetical protein